MKSKDSRKTPSNANRMAMAECEYTKDQLDCFRKECFENLVKVEHALPSVSKKEVDGILDQPNIETHINWLLHKVTEEFAKMRGYAPGERLELSPDTKVTAKGLAILYEILKREQAGDPLVY